jgi:tetratricopeptide (TPR) repeat protein
MAEEENHTHAAVSANCVLGNIHVHLQNYNLALQHFRVAQLRGGYSNDSLDSIENEIDLARALTWMGQINEARDLATHAFEVTKQYQMMHLHTMALLTLGLCDILERNLGEAQAIMLDAEQIAQDNGLVYEQTWGKIGRARIALSERQFDTAEEIIKDILEVSDRHKMAWLKLRGLNFCFQLYNATQKPTLLFCRSEFDQLIKHLSEHTQSDALKQSFDSARQYWGEGHAYP